MKTPNLNKYGLEFAGPRSSKRFYWRSWLLDLIIGAAIMALLWWSFSALSGARPSTINHRPSTMLHAGVGAAWLGYGVFFAVLAGVVVWASRRGRAAERAEDAWQPPEGYKPVPFEIVDPLADGDTLKREQRAHEKMPEGMTRQDAAEIARAAAAELELCRRMVDGALRGLSVDDYGDALAGTSKRLAQVRVTLRELAWTFDRGGIKA